MVLPDSLLVLVSNARGFSVVGDESEKTLAGSLSEILGVRTDATHVAVLPDAPLLDNAATLNSIRAFLMGNEDLGAFAERRTGYELGIRDLIGRNVDSGANLVSVGTTGFVLSRELAGKSALTLPLTRYTAPALFALAREETSHFRVLPALSADPEFDDLLTDSPTLYDPSWYTKLNSTWAHVFTTLSAKGNTPSIATQAAFLHHWQWRFVHGSNFLYKQVLTDHDIDQWWSETARNLTHVNTHTLTSARSWHSHLPPSAVLELARIGGHGVTREYSEEDVVILAGKSEAVRLSRSEATVEMMKSVDGTFSFLGYITFPVEGGDTVTATLGSTTITVDDSGRYSTLEVFGRSFLRYFTFDVRVEISVFDVPLSRLALSISRDGSPLASVPLRLNFRRPHSKLMNTRAAYWRTDGLIFRFGQRHVSVTRATMIAVAIHELILCLAIVYSARSKAPSIIGLRIAHGFAALTSRYRKPVWLFADKMITAGDNGEYVYNYARQQADAIRKFYVLDARSHDAQRFASEGIPFVRFGSLRHKLLYLTADIVFLTHTVSTLNNGFPRGVEKFFRGLFNARVVFIQHGLSVQYLPRILNKAFDGVDHYCVASPIERQTLETRDYGYRPEEVFDTGLARFDGLVDRQEKTILIAPTWRNYLALPTDASNAKSRHRGTSQNFLSSEFYAIYRRVLTDETLIDTARREGYRFKFLLHPFLSGQLEHFMPFSNDVVDVVSATSNVRYEDLLTEAAVLVTDFSGIQFDFAYMKKPIVYFQPSELPPSYKDSIFRYEEHAFGRIATSTAELARELNSVMRTNQSMSKRFVTRVDKFFYYSDRNNCERIYRVARDVSEPTNRR